MVCIYCGSKTNVLNSRDQKRSNTKWRRRSCSGCKAIMTTIESFDLSTSLSVTRPDSLYPFSRDKLFVSIYYCCKHLTDPERIASDLTNTVTYKLLPYISDGSITSNQIIKTTAETLKNFDKPAQVQYLAYHPLNS